MQSSSTHVYTSEWLHQGRAKRIIVKQWDIYLQWTGQSDIIQLTHFLVLDSFSGQSSNIFVTSSANTNARQSPCWENSFLVLLLLNSKVPTIPCHFKALKNWYRVSFQEINTSSKPKTPASSMASLIAASSAVSSDSHPPWRRVNLLRWTIPLALERRKPNYFALGKRKPSPCCDEIIRTSICAKWTFVW